MPRGGARPNSGPKPDPNSRRSLAKARKLAKDAGFTAPDGRKTERAPKGWPFGTQEPAQAAVAPAPTVEPDGDPEIAGDTPLEFLLAVVRSKNLKLPLRMQAAAIAAPFVHAKPAPGGKKVAQAEAAKGAGAGKFAAQAPPLKLVNR